VFWAAFFFFFFIEGYPMAETGHALLMQLGRLGIGLVAEYVHSAAVRLHLDR